MHEEPDGARKYLGFRDPVPVEGWFPDPERMQWHSWGGLVWQIADNFFSHPSAPHPGGPADYKILIRLRRNDQGAYAHATGLHDADFVGDSELDLRAAGSVNQFMRPGGSTGVPPLMGNFIANDQGRAGAIRVITLQAARMADAYEAALNVFNLVAMDLAIRHSVPLRRGPMLIARVDVQRPEWAVVTPLGYPNVPGDIELNHPVPMVRMFANYAEALASNSPFYSFLSLFALVEFLTRALQSRLRRLHRIAPIQFENLSGSLTAEEVRYVGHYLAGTTFGDLLERVRPRRNAVAHFLIERSSRPFSVVAEDEIALERDALKIAARRLLQIAERNVNRFLAAGIGERMLTTAFEGRLDETSSLVNVLRQRLRLLQP